MTETFGRTGDFGAPPPDFPTKSTDSEFKQWLEGPGFDLLAERHTQVRFLEAIEHTAEGYDRSVLMHTKDVLSEIETDHLRDIEIEGVDVNLPELVRMVALYHDLDKGIKREQPGIGDLQAKNEAVQRAIEELQETNPELLKGKAEKMLFEVLMKTCDYFGNNLLALGEVGPGQPVTGKRRSELLQSILDVKVHRQLKRLDQIGVEMEPEDLLQIQHALSKADTRAITIFKPSSPKIDALLEELEEKL